MDPNDLISENQSKKIKVKEIKVEGVCNVNDRFLYAVTKPLLDAETLGDAIIGSRNIAARFKKMDVFKDIKISIENASDEEESNCNCTIVFKVQEAPRFYAHTGADFGSHDGSMNVSVKLRNVFGNGETLTGKSSYGINNSTFASKNIERESQSNPNDGPSLSANEIVFSKPLFADPDLRFQSSIYQLDRNHSTSMSFKEKIRGFSVKMKSLLNDDGSMKYELGYDAVWRHNHSISPDSSISIRRDAGHSLKSSISHEVEIDTRNDIVFPSTGSFLKFFQEFAGIGGNVAFLKSEMHSQKAFPFVFGTSISGTFRAGYLCPLKFRDYRDRSMINDRFHLGGPTSLRGFEAFGLGPKEKGDSLGGNGYYAFGVDLMFPLPVISRSILQGHLFLNAGNLTSTSNFSSLVFDKFLSIPESMSTGFGLILRFTSFRLELNYCIPLKSNLWDSVKPGFQIGIGMHFM